MDSSENFLAATSKQAGFCPPIAGISSSKGFMICYLMRVHGMFKKRKASAQKPE